MSVNLKMSFFITRQDAKYIPALAETSTFGHEPNQFIFIFVLRCTSNKIMFKWTRSLSSTSL